MCSKRTSEEHRLSRKMWCCLRTQTKIIFVASKYKYNHKHTFLSMVWEFTLDWETKLIRIINTCNHKHNSVGPTSHSILVVKSQTQKSICNTVHLRGVSQAWRKECEVILSEDQRCMRNWEEDWREWECVRKWKNKWNCCGYRRNPRTFHYRCVYH